MQKVFSIDDAHIQLVEANVRDERSVANAIAGSHAVVNAVSLYVEHGDETFHSVHVEAARRVAVQAHRAGIKHLVHVSGIGSDPRSRSLYIRKRGEGELAVLGAFANAILIRPAVMFGPDDAFLTTILNLLQRLPIYPMFGNGLTRLQPAYVEDVAEAIVRVLQRTETDAITFECGGPRIYTYEELLRLIAREAGLKRILIPVPFAAWQVLAWIAEMMPSPPIARNQVELMQVDNVPSAEMPGFAELGISPHAVEKTLQEILRNKESPMGLPG
jgi:NADH dehydrogenase